MAVVDIRKIQVVPEVLHYHLPDYFYQINQSKVHLFLQNRVTKHKFLSLLYLFPFPLFVDRVHMGRCRTWLFLLRTFQQVA